MNFRLKLYFGVIALLFFCRASIAQESMAEKGSPEIVMPKADTARGTPLWQPYYIFPRGGKQHVSLDGGWGLAYMDRPISVPEQLVPSQPWVQVAENTSIQVSLFKAGLLPDPYAHLNAQQYRWIEQKAWYYKKSFKMPAEGKGNYAFLNFDGIDYYARIWLNGKLLGQHEGMFGGPAVEVSKYINYGGENQLLVEVLSANFAMKKKFNPMAPGSVIKGWAFTGGTGVEPFFTVGMWNGARIDIVAPVHIERPFLTTKSISEKEAVIEIDVEAFYKKHSLQYKLHPWGNAILSRGVPTTSLRKVSEHHALQVSFTDAGGKKQTKEFPVSLFEGRNWLKEKIVVSSPKLWWPNGLGNAELYDVEVSLLQDGKVLDQIDLKYGIRSIDLLPNVAPRVEERWQNWHFSVNSKPIFLKGVNWMPADVLMDMPPERYRWLLEMAKHSGIQLIRVWGSGLIETETFYNLCNELGIMVWQDFPISHYDAPDYPADVWEAQILYNVFRLRNHPSLAVYNGGNGHNPYSHGNNRTLGILERVLKDFDPTRMFSRTSSDAGNAHLYPDIDPSFYPYLYKYIPLVSETGMHSIANPAELRKIITSKELDDLSNMYSKTFAAAHPEFISHFAEFEPVRVPRMLSRASHIADTRNPTLETLAEATQIGAGEFYQVLSDGLQGNYPYTSGLMPWVFNRTWPVVSGIMLVDGFGQPAAPYYFLKRTYEPVHVKLDLTRLFWKAGEKFPINVKVSNSKDQSIEATVKVQIFDDSFQLLHQQEAALAVTKGTSVSPLNMQAVDIPKDYKDRFLFARVELLDSQGKQISQSVYWPRVLSSMDDPDVYKRRVSLANAAAWPTFDKGPWLKPTVAKTKGKMKAVLLSSKLDSAGYTRAVIEVYNTGKIPLFMINIAMEGALFYADDNFFWLNPGQRRSIQVRIKRGETMDRKQLGIAISAWNAPTQRFKLSTAK